MGLYVCSFSFVIRIHVHYPAGILGNGIF